MEGMDRFSLAVIWTSMTWSSSRKVSWLDRYVAGTLVGPSTQSGSGPTQLRGPDGANQRDRSQSSPSSSQLADPHSRMAALDGGSRAARARRACAHGLCAGTERTSAGQAPASLPAATPISRLSCRLTFSKGVCAAGPKTNSAGGPSHTLTRAYSTTYGQSAEPDVLRA